MKTVYAAFIEVILFIFYLSLVTFQVLPWSFYVVFFLAEIFISFYFKQCLNQHPSFKSIVYFLPLSLLLFYLLIGVVINTLLPNESFFILLLLLLSQIPLLFWAHSLPLLLSSKHLTHFFKGRHPFYLALGLFSLNLFLTTIGHLPALSSLVITFFILSFVSYYLIIQHLILHAEYNFSIKQQNADFQHRLINRINRLIDVNDNLHYQSITHPLTGLYNYHYLTFSIDQLITAESSCFCLIYFDLQRFSYINNLHGHLFGDKLLTTIAKRLQKEETSLVTPLHFEGSHFALIYRNNDYTDILNFIHHLESVLKFPIVIQDFRFIPEFIFGIARFPQDSSSKEELILSADLAKREAQKASLTVNYCFFSNQLMLHQKRHRTISLLLKSANYRTDFKLYYQPQINIKNGQLTGMEALIRWQHPRLGFIPPSEFIPIAEELGIITDMSAWIFETAISQIKIWNEKYHQQWVMCINVSPLSFSHVHFYQDFKELINLYLIPTEWLELELTENIAFSNEQQIKDVFTKLTNLGINIAIDDFGTGYSSIDYLNRFTVDRLKIAKELIDDITIDEHPRQIVQAIILMSLNLGISVIAEGVESKEQVDILRNLGCDVIQGYYFGHPLSADDFEKNYLPSSSN